MQFPVIHLGGSDPEEMFRHMSAALGALNEAVFALQDCAPHGRLWPTVMQRSRSSVHGKPQRLSSQDSMLVGRGKPRDWLSRWGTSSTIGCTATYNERSILVGVVLITILFAHTQNKPGLLHVRRGTPDRARRRLLDISAKEDSDD